MRLFAFCGLWIASVCTLANAQMVLATFETDSKDLVEISTANTKSELFTMMPSVVDNPEKTGINTSAKCLGATNVANADWYGNFVSLKLTNPIEINNNNRLLSMKMLRTVQGKDFRIGFNGYEEDSEVYKEKLSVTNVWERIVIDLGTSYLGKTLSEIYIVYSCNWDEPRKGWGVGSYYIDDVKLSSAATLDDAEVIIDPAVTYQTIHHFGSSDAWNVDFVCKYFPENEYKAAAEKLFSKEFDVEGNPQGIGLSCWRVNVGAGSAEQGDDSGISDATRRAECFLKENGEYDWTKQIGQQKFMKLAMDYGVEHFTLFSNSAPVYYTKTGKAHTNSTSLSCNITTENMPKFADFLATVTRHFVDEGYNISLLSPVNEPQYDWGGGQEGSPWGNYDIASMTRCLDAALEEKGLETKILVPEAGQYDKMFGGDGRASNQIFNLFGPTYNIGKLSHVAPYAAGHSYWTYTSNHSLYDARSRLLACAEKYNVGLMQTEFSFMEVPQQGNGFPSSAVKYIDYALYMAKVIHSDLAFANMSAWNYWTTMERERYSQLNRFYLLRLCPTGGDYADLTKGGTIEANKNLWALGNYSFFIRPGYRRVKLEGAAEMNNLLASAYVSPDGGKLVVVYINTAQIRRFTDVKLKNCNQEIISVKKYVTSASSDLKLSTTSTSATHITIPARSVCTVVIDLKEDSGINNVVADDNKNIVKKKGVYMLNGTKVEQVGQNGPGIYIKDGTKVLVRQ